jgi:DNA adenine methylase
MGGVFLRRRLAPRGEIVNDRSGDVATFFRILQRHYVPFMEMLKWQITGRREFERLKASDPATLTDLERAARFLYLQRTAFGGKVAGRNFGVDPLGGRFNVTKLGADPRRAARAARRRHDRVPAVADFIRRYDRPGTLFYLDPPYWGSEGDYGKELFGREEYERMAEVLSGLKGRFILSINDVPAIRRAFAGFRLQPVRLTYTVTSGKRQPARELIISGRENYLCSVGLTE